MVVVLSAVIPGERGEPVWNRLEGQSQQGVLVRRNAVGGRKEMVIPRFWL